MCDSYILKNRSFVGRKRFGVDDKLYFGVKNVIIGPKKWFLAKTRAMKVYEKYVVLSLRKV